MLKSSTRYLTSSFQVSLEDMQSHISPLLFHHISKTAGTSLLKILEANYTPEACLFCYGKDKKHINAQLLAGDTSALAGMQHIKCVATHRPLAWVPYLPPDFQAITMLRHPVDRVVSIYHYIQSIPRRKSARAGLKAADMIRNQNWTIEDIYDNLSELKPNQTKFKNFNSFFNGQVRHLIRPYSGMTYAEMRDIPYGDVSFLEDISHQILQEKLEKNYTVGIVEEFSSSIKRFAGKFGWNTLIYPRERVSNRPGIDQISTQLREKILIHNQLDLALWKKVKDTYDSPSNLLESDRSELDN